MVHAALVAIRRFAGQPQTAGRAAHRSGPEHGAFQKHAAAFVRDLRGQATHDSGQGHGPRGVADKSVARFQHAFLPVQSHQAFTLGGRSHNNAAAFQLVAVKGVQRLAQFHQNIVGDVHQVGNGAHPHGVQPVAHPGGRGHDPGVFQHAAGIGRAQIAVRHLYRKFRGHVGAGLPHLEGGQGQGQAIGRRHFAREAQHRQAVAPVGGDADVQHLAVEVVGFDEAFARSGLASGPVGFGQDQDAAVILGKAQFTLGTDHAERGHPAQFGLFDGEAARQGGPHRSHGHQLTGGHVGRAAYDGEGFALPHVHRGHMQMVRVGVHVAGQHPPQHHVFDTLVGTDHFLQLQAEHGQPFAQFLRRAFVGHELPQPVETQKHCRTLTP